MFNRPTRLSGRPVDFDRQGAGLLQHGRTGIHAMNMGGRMAAFQQGRMLARAATQIPDLGRREILGQAHQQI